MRKTKSPIVSKEITIRIATSQDDQTVGALLEASYPVLMRAHYEPAILAAALPLMTRPSPALLSSGSYYLAEVANGALVGCGGWTRERPGSGEVVAGLGHIRHFATHPDRTMRGIGRMLYAECEAAARLAGIRRFACYASLNGERFYAALGFRSVRRIDVPMAPSLDFPSILMERSI